MQVDLPVPDDGDRIFLTRIRDDGTVWTLYSDIPTEAKEKFLAREKEAVEDVQKGFQRMSRSMISTIRERP